MRFHPRSVLSLVLGGTLLVLAQSHPVARAADAPETAPAPASPATSGVPESSSSGETELPKPTAEELRFVQLTNQERAKHGLRQLEIDPLLIAVARKHSAEMRDKDYFGHESPTPGIKTPLERFLLAATEVRRPAYACVGENLFYCSIVDVQRGHKALMNSPTHRENILFPRFEKMGVGIIKNARGEFWVTQMFLATTDPLVASKKLSSSRTNKK